MKVRPIRAADRAALVELLGSDDTFREDEREVALELIDAAIAGTDDYQVRVAELSGVLALPTGLAGYVCYGPTPMTAATYDLYWIATHRAARRRGVASALIQAMEHEVAARGGGTIRVETSEQDSHGAARALYARHGYPEAARLADFYAPGDALIVYYKRLCVS